MKIKYVVFPTLNEFDLYHALNGRAKELGYHGPFLPEGGSLTLDIDEGKIMVSAVDDMGYHVCNDDSHIDGDFRAFFFTDTYKFVKEKTFKFGDSVATIRSTGVFFEDSNGEKFWVDINNLHSIVNIIEGLK